MAEEVEISVHRSTSYADRLRPYTIKVDGVAQASVRPKGTAKFRVPVGEHVLSLSIDWCGSNPVSFQAVPGKPISFECGSNLTGWRLALALVYVLFRWNDYLWLRLANEVPKPAS